MTVTLKTGDRNAQTPTKKVEGNRKWSRIHWGPSASRIKMDALTKLRSALSLPVSLSEPPATSEDKAGNPKLATIVDETRLLVRPLCMGLARMRSRPWRKRKGCRDPIHFDPSSSMTFPLSSIANEGSYGARMECVVSVRQYDPVQDLSLLGLDWPGGTL